MDNQLSKEELDILIEALDVWEKDDISLSMITSIVGTMITEESKQQWKEKTQTEEIKRKAETKIRKETSLLLKAKLVQIKHNMDVTNILKQSK